MDLDYLDQLIPQRWTLLLYYWLPFFKTPSNFYFQYRLYVDKLKNELKSSSYRPIPWQKLPDLISILEYYIEQEAKEETEIAQEIITKIFTRKAYEKNMPKILNLLFASFNPDDKRTPILSEVFRRIPTKWYVEYLKTLNAANCTSRHLKWLIHFKKRFKLEDKLTLILSLPDETLETNPSLVMQLAINECKDKLSSPNTFNEFFNLFSPYTIRQLLGFIFTRNAQLIFSNCFIENLIKHLLKKDESILTSYTFQLDIHAKNNFFKNFLADNLSDQQNNQYFLSFYPREQWSGALDQLIKSTFNEDDEANIIDITNNSLKENKLTLGNWKLFLVGLKEAGYPVNLFQFLTIQSLWKSEFDLITLKKVSAIDSSLDYCKRFSLSCQSYVAEKSIQAIKIFLKDNFMSKIHKKTTRHDIHRTFYQFFNNEYIGKPLNVSELILKKLPKHLQLNSKVDLDFLQQLLSQLYLIVEDPAITEYKNKCLLAWAKNQRAYEERSEAGREILQNLYEGKQSTLSYQRMQALFGAKAPMMQKKWKEKLGVHFFDATNKIECKLACKKAATPSIKSTSQYNDITCLSTAPSTISYFTA